MRRASGIATLFLFAGCSSSSESPSLGAPAGDAAGEVRSEAGAFDPDALADRAPDADPLGGSRPVSIHVPPGYVAGIPAPLVIMLHGYSASGAIEESYLMLTPLSDARGFLYAYPDGTVDANGLHFWNATDACCDVDGSGIDDSSYLAGLITEIRSHVAIDPRRVFVVGHSNGAFMSYRMACDHADTIAAIVSLAGAPPASPAACRPSEPVAILQVQGDADDQVRVEGGSLTGNLAAGDERLRAYPPLEASLAEWATLNGCSAARTPSTMTLDLERSLLGAKGPDETLVSAYRRCRPGGAVELWMIQGGGHGPDFTDDLGARVVDFLLSHAKPA